MPRCSSRECGRSAYEMADAAGRRLGFFWSEFCDWFVEMAKPALRGAVW